MESPGSNKHHPQLIKYKRIKATQIQTKSSNEGAYLIGKFFKMVISESGMKEHGKKVWESHEQMQKLEQPHTYNYKIPPTLLSI